MAGSGLKTHARLMCGAASAALLLWAGSAHAETGSKVEIAPQPLASALNEFGVQTGRQVIFAPALTGAKTTRGVKADGDIEMALAQLLEGSGLTFRRDEDTFLIVQGGSSAPQSGSAAGDGADGTVEALIVTAQKREEDIQDVPIAISAFSQEDLTRSQVAGGPDLMTQVPNFTFTKTNFSGYSIQIRGIGTQAISATTDPAVAVAFNNTPFVRNRFFEQEFYDLQRVEVLRGPQGTLYGRNATAGVVNIISAKPALNEFQARLSADLANYSSTRLEGMVNVPLADDKVALRIAGAWTKREGYDKNQITGNQIDGRDLWSTRVSLRVEPTDHVKANLIWEHFEEDDDRIRSGKQLCHADYRTEIEGYRVQNDFNGNLINVFTQGCLPASLYSPDSFETPNGQSIPYFHPLAQIFLPVPFDMDPYASARQSPDLRVIESTVDPKYQAETNTVELQISIDLPSNLTIESETGYLSDELFSMEDYNRFNTQSGIFDQALWESYAFFPGVYRPNLLRDGVFCDPQIGCADRLVAVDSSTAKSRQFSQEFRLSSSYEGKLNFSAGANFLRYDTEDKYYLFINTITMLSAISPYRQILTPLPAYIPSVSDNHECLSFGLRPPNPASFHELGRCTYVDPNPIGSLNDLGHNYFLSRNPYKLISYAAFGELYYDLTPDLTLTAGLRWTVDRKEAPRIPSWLLAAETAGHPIMEVVRQDWSEPTGRMTLDWKPALPFTDETLLYASLAHGYKAGGANPPPTGFVMWAVDPDNPGDETGNGFVAQGMVEKSATHPKTFDPEFVNAFEVGTKNTLADGRVTLNADAFYYDYTGYQISQIVDRSAINYNFDARVWGLELEAEWRPLENLRLGFKGGYENTRVADGMQAVDVMDRTAGHSGWVVARPFPTFPSNCILPAESLNRDGMLVPGPPGMMWLGNPGPCEAAYVLNYDPATVMPYTPNPTQWRQSPGSAPEAHDFGSYAGFDPKTAPNHGEGFYKDLGGNELPNAPHFTATLTGDYTLPLPNSWLATLHGDFYYQSEAWTRIFNMEGYDKLKAYTNVNVAAIFTNEDAGWKVMAYVKNVFDRDSITGAFLNSDDTGLTTNVFLTEPRLYGLRVTKEWNGQAWWSRSRRPEGGVWPFTVEIGGMVQRHDAPYASIEPAGPAFSPALDPARAEHRDLDRGDGREISLGYQPSGGRWGLSARYRYGRANNGLTRLHSEEHAGPKVCAAPLTGPFGSLGKELCDPDYVHQGGLDKYSPRNLKYGTNWSDVTARDREEHQFVDFMVHRDIGLGAARSLRSRIQAGLRGGHLESHTGLTVRGVPDWQLSEGFLVMPSPHHRFDSSLHVEREFEGAGPEAGWSAGARLWEAPDAGRVDLDWTVSAGVLFGKQRTSAHGVDGAQYATNPYPGDALLEPMAQTPVATTRSNSATVPVVDLSLGLSYEIERVKLSGGYHWERYFDVLDAGYAETKQYDRTFEGPYFKLSVGFGG